MNWRSVFSTGGSNDKKHGEEGDGKKEAGDLAMKQRVEILGDDELE